MKKCKYCGRYYKNYQDCPGCGSPNYEEVRNEGCIRIDKVPEDGYKIDMSNLKRDGIIGTIFRIVGLLLLGYSFLLFLIILLVLISTSIVNGVTSIEGMEEIGDYLTLGIIIMIIIPPPIIGWLFYWIGQSIDNNRKITNKNLERLRKNGILIKNLKYKKNKDQIEIVYEAPSGKKIPFISNPIYNFPTPLPDTCDILFDKEDPGIYYIGFDIY